MEKKQNNVVYVMRIALILLIICSLTAAAVSLVYALTYKKADENIAAQKREAMEEIFGEGIKTTTAVDFDGLGTLKAVIKGEELLGYTISITEAGFGGDMEIMVGYMPDGRIKEVKLISHSETPGLGSRVGESEHIGQYVGKGSGTLVLSDDVDAISGSTISSKAMLAAVNQANSCMKSYLDMKEGDR